MITPTIGRKVWFWPINPSVGAILDPLQAWDATVTFVHPNGNINLLVIDHHGVMMPQHDVYLFQGMPDERPKSTCATWMPYQIGQAKQA